MNQPAHTSGPVTITIIVARANNGVIGAGNAMPWHLPEELQHFKSTTMGHAVIMGRKTFDSIGKPLPGRRIIVVTRNNDWHLDGVETAPGIDEALALCREPNERATRVDQVFVAGGAQLYRLALPVANRLLITEIDLEVDGDTFFPDPDTSVWQRQRSDRFESEAGSAYRIEDWQRIEPPQSSA